jgi:DNA mismatch repair protein MutL
MPIRVLPTAVATRIAAGEVVERPASVIKELMENAIDAGASEIRLEIHAGGRQQMRVQDDGCGIPADQVELAFARHSTSKLTSVEDLESIRTLGFRGEALASIASVARITLETRAVEEEIGTQLRLEGGTIVDREPSGRPAGTAISVQDLFFNVPARLKFLRTERTERRHIDMLVTRYAMAYPDLRLTLVHNGRTTFQSHGTGDLREVLAAVYGAPHADKMLEIIPHAQPDGSDSSIHVHGFVSAPALHRSNRNEITLFVNGRWVQDHRLTFAVTQAYHTLLMTGRYPLAVVKITLPPQDVDVNVHPAKTQVRFRDGDAIFRAVQRAIRHTLLDQTGVPQMQSASNPKDGTNWPGAWPTPEQVLRHAQLRALGKQTSQHTAPSPPRATQFTLDQELSQAGTQGKDAASHAVAPSSPTAAPSSPHQVPPLRVVGQLGLTYMIAEGPKGMFLIDQHAAHERVLYEKFVAAKTRSEIATQALLEPLTVELSMEGAGLVEENLDALLTLGFDVEPFGSNTLLVRAVPAAIAGQDIQSVFDEIVADLQIGNQPLAEEIEARIIRRVCKRAAIKAGQSLSRQEMEELIRQLEACDSPTTCPHGRPTMIHLSADQLAKEFGRLG